MGNGIAHALGNSPIPLVPLFPNPQNQSCTSPVALLGAAIWIWGNSTMNDIEVKRLAHAINELRPSWPISSLTTFISRNLSARPFRDAAMALVWVALDCDGAGNYVTDTPKRVLEAGPWWKAAEMNGTANMTPTPPKRTEQCRDCGRHVNSCLCESGPTPYGTKPTTADPTTGLAACRAAAGLPTREAS